MPPTSSTHKRHCGEPIAIKARNQTKKFELIYLIPNESTSSNFSNTPKI